jgi:hypothetical protein
MTVNGVAPTVHPLHQRPHLQTGARRPRRQHQRQRHPLHLVLHQAQRPQLHRAPRPVKEAQAVATAVAPTKARLI